MFIASKVRHSETGPMRGILSVLCLLTILLGSRPLPAQQACDAPYRPILRHRLHRPHRVSHAPCPCDSCRPPEPEEPTSPAGVQGGPAAVTQSGAYAVPPQSGDVVGPSNSVGIRGAEITLPALRLSTPSIRFPSLFRSRRNPFMRTNSTVAPFVQSTPTVAIPPAQVMMAQGVQTSAVADTQGEDESDDKKDVTAQGAKEERLDAKLREIHRCLRRLEALQHAPPPCCPYPADACDCAYHAGIRVQRPSFGDPSVTASRRIDPTAGQNRPASDATIRRLAHEQEYARLAPPRRFLVEQPARIDAVQPMRPRGRIVGVSPLHRLPATRPANRQARR